MLPVVLWYRHLPAGAPLLRVCGLSLVKRALLALRRAGHTDVRVVVADGDEALVLPELDDHRLGPVDVTTSEELPPGDSLLILGDRVWVPGRLDDLVQKRAPGFFRGPAEDHGALLANPPTEAGGDGWRRVASPADIPEAETLLLRSLVKPADGIISRHINRKISLFLSRRLAGTGIRPNHVTLVVLAIGVLSGPLASQGTYLGFLLGGLCYYVSAILDGVDGELSRLKHLGSPLGAWFDTITDDVVGTSWLIGMYMGLDRGATYPLWRWIGLVAVACAVVSILVRYYMLVAFIGSGDHQKLAAKTRTAPATSALGRAFEVVRDTLARTDFLPFFALVTAAVGFVPAFAAPYALGAAGALVDTFVTLSRARAATSSGPSGS